MSFLERFEKPEAVNGGCRRVRDRETGHTVLLHVLPRSAEWVREIDNTPGVVVRGSQAGVSYVVTEDRPELIDLHKWVEQKKLPATDSGEFTQFFWATGEAASSLPVPGAPVPPKATGGADDSTQMFRPAPPPDDSPLVVRPDQADEPTKLFQPTQSASPVPPRAAPKPAFSPEAPSGSEPGEFTKLFRASPPGLEDPSPQPVAKREPAAAATQEGEFTKLFRSSPKPGESPPPASAAKQDLAPAVTQEGEFTKLFRTPPAPADSPIGERPLPKQESATLPPEEDEVTKLFRTSPHPAEIPSSDQPSATQASAGRMRDSDATKLFQSSPQAVKTPSPQPGAKQEPASAATQEGEFTKLFRTSPQPVDDVSFPNQAVPKQQRPSTVPITDPHPRQDAGPGEFTRVFEAQRGATIPPPLPPETGSSRDFNDFYQSSYGSDSRALEDQLESGAPLAPERPLTRDPGDFTRLFGRPGGTAPPPDSGPAGATKVFEVPRKPEPAGGQIHQPSSGPSEYTRMFQRPSAAAGQPAPPKGSDSPAPTPNPAVPSLNAKSSMLLPALVLGGLLLIAIAVVIFFAVRH